MFGTLLDMYKKYMLGAGAVCILAILGGWYWFQGGALPAAVSVDAEDGVVRGPGYTIEQVAIDESDAIPDIERPVQFSPTVPPEIRVTIEQRAEEARVILRADKTDAGAWLNLALWYHAANDYDGARAVWEFMTRVAPNDTTAFDNLGKLYHFALRDFSKAEQYFLESKKINPESTVPYVELFQLYTLSLKNEQKAFATMAEAEAHFPGDAGFAFTLGAYFRDTNRPAGAREAFLRALDTARAAGNIELVSQINVELAKL